MSLRISFQATGLLVLIAFLTLGCGKKVDEAEPLPTRTLSPQIPEAELDLSRQEVFCGADRSCPSYLTKIVISDKNQLSFCTGFLTLDDVVVTASSCLPERLRYKDISCEKDIFFFFAEENGKTSRVGCSKVLEASALQTKDAVLWRSNVAYLKLEKPLKRRKLIPTRSGMSDRDKFYTWSVDQIDANQGVIRKSDDCQAVHETFFNPLSDTNSSPVMSLADCAFNEGNSGSPVLDYRGRVRGVISRPVSKEQIEAVVALRILEKPLKPILFVSNYACAPLYPDQEVLNDNECNRRLDLTAFDRAQKEMLDETNLFRKSLQRVEAYVNEKNRYLKLVVNLEPVEESQNVQVIPKCFKNASKWVHEFNSNKMFTFSIDLPVIQLKRSMNEFGLISARETVKPLKPTNFQFKPSVLRMNQSATVFMWSDGPTTTFSNLPGSCESLF